MYDMATIHSAVVVTGEFQQVYLGPLVRGTSTEYTHFPDSA